MVLRNPRYPVVLQYDQADCGPASLLSVLRYYRGNSSLVYMRQISNTNAQGSTMLDIVHAARKIGFDARGASGEYEDLMKEKMPCIAHVLLNQFSHFVVVYRIDQNRVLIGDPAKGLYWLSKLEFCDIWRTRAVVLLAVHGPVLNQHVPIWKDWIGTYIHHQLNWIYQIVFLAVSYTFLGLLTSVFIQILIDRYIPEKDIEKVLILAGLLLIATIMRSTAAYLKEYFLVSVNKNINNAINKEFLFHLFRLPQQFFDSRKTGDITTRIADSVRIQQAISYCIGTMFIDGLLTLASLIFVFFFSFALGCFIAAVIPIYIGLLILKVRKLRKQQYEVLKNYATVESAYIDSLAGIDEILSFSSSSSFSLLNTSLFQFYQNNVQKLGLIQAKLSMIAEGFGSLIVVATIVGGALFVIKEQMKVGEMMASYALIAGMLPSILRLVYGIIVLQAASVATTRLMDLFLVEEESEHGVNAVKIEKELRVKKVSFTWANNGPLLLKDIDLCLPCGRVTGLWGRSGCGKSTLVRLLQRKYKVNAGSITIDDMDSSLINLGSYRNAIAVVPQQVKIFNATLLENILMGKNVSSLKEVENRIYENGLSVFVERLGKAGLLTILGEDGRRLSSGEKQMVGIMRALFSKPSILVLDEALTAIDPEIEKQLYDIFKEYSKTNAVLIISHNISTLLHTDYLYLLENNTISDEGMSNEVLMRKGLLSHHTN